jgi:hypothetical protein
VQETVVSELIDKELQKGFIYGPFTHPPFDNYRVRPIGVAEFDNLSRAVCYIAEYNYNIKNILHLLDDFLTVDLPNAIAERTMAIMTMIFNKLNIPIAAHKTTPFKSLRKVNQNCKSTRHSLFNVR